MAGIADKARGRRRRNGKQENSKAGIATPARRWLWISLGFLVGALVATAISTLRTARRPTATAEQKAPPPAGMMWPGELERIRIELFPPPDFVKPESCLTAIEPWVLPGFTREDLVALLRENLIPDELQQSILASAQCTPGRCVVTPSAEVVYALEPLTRLALYRLLADLPGNASKRTPFRFRPSEWSEFQRGLSRTTIDLLQRLTVNERGWVLFWDSGALCQRMPDDDKVPFIKLVTKQESYLVMLVLRKDTDLEPIIRYWTSAPRQKSYRVLLQSVKPTGDEVRRLDIVHLLSPFLRALAYTYPNPGDPNYDCHWTTFNFFRDTPDDRYLDGEVVQREFSQYFEPIARDYARYGDVVAIMNPQGVINHTAIFLAEDLVFSKNGNSLYSPWVVTTIDFLLRLYGDTPGTHAAFFRRREQ